MEFPKKLVAACTAVAFALGGVSIEGVSLPDLFPTPHVATDPFYGGPEAAKKLLGSNAAVNIIDVPISNATTAKQQAMYDNNDTNKLIDKDAKTLVKDLHSPKGVLRSAVRKAFSTATYGRYKPSAVNYEKTAPLTLENGCIDYWHDDKLQPLYDFIKSNAKPDQLNVAVVEAFVCNPPRGQMGVRAFGSANIIPIVALGELGSTAGTIVHEAGGHYLGLPHAGTAECTDVINIQGCDVNETADKWSLMAYRSANTFTVPELYKLGLLRPDEVLDLHGATTSQEVTLTDISHKGGIKLVIGKTAAGKELYISWDKDDSAGYTEECVVVKSLYDRLKGVREEDLLDGAVWKDADTGKDRYFSCYKTQKTSQTHSLQERVDARAVNAGTNGAYDWSSFVLVSPKGEKIKGTDYYMNEDRAFREPSEVVYAGAGGTRITYVSANKKQAVITVG